MLTVITQHLYSPSTFLHPACSRRINIMSSLDTLTLICEFNRMLERGEIIVINIPKAKQAPDFHQTLL